MTLFFVLDQSDFYLSLSHKDMFIKADTAVQYLAITAASSVVGLKALVSAVL